eukprot:1360373-Amphidinium_carterae.1
MKCWEYTPCQIAKAPKVQKRPQGGMQNRLSQIFLGPFRRVGETPLATLWTLSVNCQGAAPKVLQ